MNRKMVRTITLGTFALVAVLCAARPGRAADANPPYPSMAPLDQYLMDRNAETAWTGAFDNNPEFWNPKNRGPLCFNPPAARTVLPITFMRTKFVLAGQSKDEIHESMKAAVEKKELPEVAPDAMTYMLSKQGHLNDRAGHWVPHLMFYVPLKDAETWGAGAPDSPILVNPHFNGAPEPVTEFMVPVSEWSDGTPADAH